MRKLAELSVRYPTTVLMAVLAVAHPRRHLLPAAGHGPLSPPQLAPALRRDRGRRAAAGGDGNAVRLAARIRRRPGAERHQRRVLVAGRQSPDHRRIPVERRHGRGLPRPPEIRRRFLGRRAARTRSRSPSSIRTPGPSSPPPSATTRSPTSTPCARRPRPSSATSSSGSPASPPSTSSATGSGRSSSRPTISPSQAYGLTMDTLATTIQSFNRNLTGGSIVEMGIRYTIRGVGAAGLARRPPQAHPRL